jgi:hypothetical protein
MVGGEWLLMLFVLGVVLGLILMTPIMGDDDE